MYNIIIAQMSRNYLTVFWHPLFEVFPGFVWLKLHSEVILILTSDTFTSKNVLYINCLKKKRKNILVLRRLHFLPFFHHYDVQSPSLPVNVRLGMTLTFLHL